MKIHALERILFAAGFVLAAGICLGFLFGYRYSFDQQRLEQRGVLVLNGVMEDVDITVHGLTKTVSLPYVDANIPLGRHHVMVNKTGYIPFSAEIDVNTEDAVIVPLELAPQLLTGQRQTFKEEPHAHVAYFRGLGVVIEKTASGTLMTHAEDIAPTEVFLPASLRSGRNQEALSIERISDMLLLVERGSTRMVYNDVRNTWKTVQISEKEEILVDQGMLLAYNREAGTLRYINMETGKPDTRPFLDTIVSVAPSKIIYVQTGDGYLLYKTEDGNLFRLQPRWFSFPAVEPLGDTDRLTVRSKTYEITSTGLLMHEGGRLEHVQQIFVQQDTVHAVTENYDIYTLEKAATPFVTRFSSPLVSIQPDPHNIYAFVQTQQTLYFCERITLNRCTQLASGAESSLQRGVDKDGQYLWYSDGASIHIVPFFQL